MLRCTFLRRALPADKKAFMELVKTLRYRTDAPIKECTAAITEADGDLDTAAELLRKKGAARAMKKGSRVTEQGFVVSCVGTTPASGAAIISLCCETDFAARNEHFQTMCRKAQTQLRGMLDESRGELLADPAEAAKALSDALTADLQAAIAVLGENVRVGGVTPLHISPHVSERIAIGTYAHGGMDVAGVGRLVGLVAVSQQPGAEANEADILTDVARHFVANMGAEGNYTHQNFFGAEEESIGKWLKRHHLKFSSSVALEFGKEPVVHSAAAPQGGGK